jgi:putative transposase
MTTAMHLYFSGESLRNTCESLQLIGMSVSHQTIYNWIKKYVTLMARYLHQIKPNVSDAWRADELYLKVRGNPKYLFALMDDQTRFWIAQQVADTKYTSNIQPLFRDAKQIAGKRPNTVITDGAANFADASKKKFQHKEPKDKAYSSHSTSGRPQ